NRHWTPVVRGTGAVFGRRCLRLAAGVGRAAVFAGGNGRSRRGPPVAVPRMTTEMSGRPTIAVRGLRKVFRQTTTAQSGVAAGRRDLASAPREVVASGGQARCGRATFCGVMTGLEAPSEVEIHIGDRSPHAGFDYFRGKIPTVFKQDRLLPWRSALGNAR